MLPTPVRRIDDTLLREMRDLLDPEACAEMAIPSYLHENPAMRFMAWWRVDLLARRLVRAAVEQRARGRRNLVVVDYGCGAGVLLEEAAALASRVVGVDIVLDAAKLLVERRRVDNVSLVLPDEAERIIEPKSVDILIAGEVLEHVEPLAPLIDRFRGWLSGPHARVLVTLPTENDLYRLGRKMAGFSGHYHHANAASITDEILARGFRLDAKESIPFGGPLSIYWCLDFAPV